MSRILRFLAIFCVTLFVSNAFAATGYVCDSYRKYTSCAEGYYLADANGTYNGTPAVGNQCISCTETDSDFCPGGTESPKYPVTLCDREDGGECYDIYASENGGIFCENWEDCENTEITKVEIPEREPDGLNSYTFLGYYDLGGEIQYIDADGNFTADATDDFINSHSMGKWYANWKENAGGCEPGYRVNDAGNACVICEAGTYQSQNGYTGKTCAECGAGKWSEDGASSCSNISAGCYGTSAGSACPHVCGAGEYSNAGVASCTSCPNTATTNYTNSGDDAAAHAGVKSCKMTCEPGTQVFVPNGPCAATHSTYAPATNGWFTGRHTVSSGDVSSVSYCPNSFSRGTDKTSACGACVNSAAVQGGRVVYNVVPFGTQVKITNNNTTSYALRISDIVAFDRNGDPIIYGLSADNNDNILDGDATTYGTIPKGESYTFRIINNAVAGIEVAFVGNGQQNSYQIDLSTDDGSSWYTVFNSYTRKTPAGAVVRDGSAFMVAQSITYKKRFVLYYEAESPKDSYIAARNAGDILLCSGYNDELINLKPCPDAYPLANTGSSIIDACYKNCPTEYDVPNSTTVTAYGSPQTITYGSGNTCKYAVSCNTGYEVAGDDSVTSNGTTYYSNPSCNAKCVNVTFINGDIENQYIYTRYDDRTDWYSDDECTEPINSIDVPGGNDWTFAGYWNQSQNSIITQDTAMTDNTTTGLRMILAPLPKGSSENKLDLDNFQYLAPGTLANPVGLYLHRAKNCAAGSGALCLGPYYYADEVEKYIYYINCCLPGYHSDVLNVSPDGGLSCGSTT